MKNDYSVLAKLELCDKPIGVKYGFFRPEGIEPLEKEQAVAYELTLAGMKTYWCVTTSVYDDGRVIAAITNSIQAVRAPKNESKSLRRKDIYHDWFSSKEEAEQFVEDAKNA